MTNNNQTFFKRKPVLIGGLLLIVAVTSVYLSGNEPETLDTKAEEVTSPRTVSLYTISANAGTAVRTADGSAFIVRSQSAGRVDSVAKVGDTLAPGATVAQIENSAQRAALTQAEGAYEAALASAAQSNVGVSEAGNNLTAAQNNVISTYKSAYNTSNGVVTGTIDPFFASPLSSIPGLRLNGRGYTDALNSGRIELQTTLPAWRDKSLSVSTSANLLALIAEARTYTTSILEMVDMFISVLQEQGTQDRYSDAEIQTFLTNFNAARASLSQTLTSLNTTEASLVSAEEAKKRADISGTSGVVSSADAQVKQALGSLQAAQANYAKTIIKTPVAGTVTAVSITVGDIINVGSDVVFVAGDTTASESTVTVPLTAVKFTPTKAYVFTVEEGILKAHEVKTGLVTSNSITISGAEGISDIVVDIRGLKDGDAVEVN